MATSGPRQTLLLFCKFLTHRVRTEHLDLLNSIALEFLESPPCFTRVDEMLYRVFPLVSILPIEITDESTRAKADRVLQRMRQCSSDRDEESVDELCGLGTALRDRIALKNWDLLERMYSDFRIGSDRTLRAFVSLQPQAIAMLPTRLSAHNIDKTSASSQIRVSTDDAFTSDTEVEVAPRARSRSHEGIDHQGISESIRIVRAELDAIEATAPWERVFDLSKISYPFDAKKHSALAQRFASFWQRNARAVWQRHFWCLPGGKEHDVYFEQREDNRNAAERFAKGVIAPLFRAFGARFFLDLDAQPKRMHWCWYREPVVDLVEMTRVEGVEYSLRYLRTQKLQRHPTPHPQFHLIRTHCESPSRSIWSTLKATKHILDAIVRHSKSTKTRTQEIRPTATGRKRLRSDEACRSDKDADDDE